MKADIAIHALYNSHIKVLGPKDRKGDNRPFFLPGIV
jgi:hypothetical protein